MRSHAHSFSASLGRGGCLPAWRVLAVASAMAVGAGSSHGCSICGCSLSSDWASQGYEAMPGLQVDLRYEYYDQSELRTGTHIADRSVFALPNDQEIQQQTLNRSAWLGLDYVFDPSWGLSVEVPYYDRFHSTVAPGDTAISTSQASGVGDLRIMGRYQSFDLKHSFGLQLGLKLPTGRFDQNFVTGPEAGTPLDRGLQLGSGTTDLLVGGSYFARPTTRLGCFAQVLADQPLNSRAGFRPAPSLGFNSGVRLLTTGALTPQLQLNVRWDGRETGVNADHGNSGGTSVYLTPGVALDAGARSHVFAFLQMPVYQRVNGLQITPRWLLSVGFRYEL